MSPIASVLVTGANVGLGYDCCRQLCLTEGITKVILGCRNPEKVEAAKKKLEESTGKTGVFEVLIIDVSNLDSVRKAVSELKEPIDGLVMNAGGAGGRDGSVMTEDGVPAIVAVNLLGYVLLVDLLLAQNKLKGSAVYAGSEIARGISSGYSSMNMSERPTIESGSVEEFTAICDGSFYDKGGDKSVEAMYPYTKLVAALWVSSMARKEPNLRFLSMSPGATTGTNVFSELPFFKKILYSILFPIMNQGGIVHSPDVGAKRYVDALLDDETYKSGIFYGSASGMTGKVVDQSEIWDVFSKEDYQDNADTAIHKFIK
jgi:NAD(P)-dependent dehydrogenase (short-subunit alcohol dehydrogenase family)